MTTYTVGPGETSVRGFCLCIWCWTQNQLVQQLGRKSEYEVGRARTKWNPKFKREPQPQWWEWPQETPVVTDPSTQCGCCGSVDDQYCHRLLIPVKTILRLRWIATQRRPLYILLWIDKSKVTIQSAKIPDITLFWLIQVTAASWPNTALISNNSSFLQIWPRYLIIELPPASYAWAASWQHPIQSKAPLLKPSNHLIEAKILQ